MSPPTRTGQEAPRPGADTSARPRGPIPSAGAWPGTPEARAVPTGVRWSSHGSRAGTDAGQRRSRWTA